MRSYDRSILNIAYSNSTFIRTEEFGKLRKAYEAKHVFVIFTN